MSSIGIRVLFSFYPQLMLGGMEDLFRASRLPVIIGNTQGRVAGRNHHKMMKGKGYLILEKINPSTRPLLYSCGFHLQSGFHGSMGLSVINLGTFSELWTMKD